MNKFLAYFSTAFCAFFTYLGTAENFPPQVSYVYPYIYPNPAMPKGSPGLEIFDGQSAFVVTDDISQYLPGGKTPVDLFWYEYAFEGLYFLMEPVALPGFQFQYDVYPLLTGFGLPADYFMGDDWVCVTGDLDGQTGCEQVPIFSFEGPDNPLGCWDTQLTDVDECEDDVDSLYGYTSCIEILLPVLSGTVCIGAGEDGSVYFETDNIGTGGIEVDLGAPYGVQPCQIYSVSPLVEISWTPTDHILPCPADVNFDGDINILDLLDVINYFGQTGVDIPVDTNEDDIVDIIDLLNIVSEFGICD